MDAPRLTRSLTDSAMKYILQREEQDDQLLEYAGFWFFPARATRRPNFFSLPNHHPQPDRNVEIRFDDIEYAIGEWYGSSAKHFNELAGQICLLHTHPGPGMASRDDHNMVEVFEKNLDGHPIWTMTSKHFIVSTLDDSWWWFDLLETGRVGWDWPDA